MAKNDELPPMGLPLTKRSSSRYFFGVIAMVVVCGAAVFAVGYGSLHFSRGPCDDLYGEALEGLRAEVKFFRKSGTAIGVSSVEIQELRTSTQLATDSLVACCEQRQEGTLSEKDFRACDERAAEIAALPAVLAAAHDDATAAKKAMQTASSRLRGIAVDLTEIAARGEPAATASVAAPPPSGAASD
jgi:hypothetical protein